MIPNAEQQAAISYLEGPLLVLAGPGTGKTQLLSAKVAHILQHTDANPENILCLTFTESGVSNMRERLGTMIGPAAADLNIYTYHAFGADLLARYQNYSEAPSRRLDSAIDEVAQQKLLREIQAQLPVRDINKTTAISDLLDTIGQAKSARLSAADLQKIAAENLADSQSLSQSATPILQNLIPRMKFADATEQVYQPLLEVLLTYTSPEPIAGQVERLANSLARELKTILDQETAADKPKVSPLSKWKDKRFERDDAGNYRLKDYIANKKLASLANIMAAYDQKLQSAGLFDFSDMIEEAINALKTDTGFRLSLSERFEYILLDEFQDTNPSQFELIKLLTAYEKPVVMAVGDDDQAIFEFQGANASNLLDFQNHYNAKVITLLDNYRSTGEILAFSHRVATQVAESFSKAHGIAKLLRSIRDQLSGQKLVGSPKTSAPPQDQPRPSQISRHEFTAATDEYYWIAREIQNLKEQGVKGSDIAIIAPKHKYIAPLLPYLKDRGLDIAYEKRSNLLEDPKIHQLLTLAHFLHELANEKQPSHRLLEILSFDFWQIPPSTAIRLLHQGQEAHGPRIGSLDYLIKSDDPAAQKLGHFLARLVAISYDTPLELFLDYLIGSATLPEHDFTSPFLTYHTTHSTESELLELYENLTTLRNTTTSHLKISKPTLKDLIAMLDDYEAAGASIVHVSPYQDSSDAVQIMSAHKSKGLEFPYVFLIAVDDLAWGQSKGNNNLFVLPANLVHIRHTGATADERLRLLFVAITRAKDHLILTNSIRDFNDKTVKRLAYLGELRDDKNSQPTSPYLPADHQLIQLHYDEFDPNTRLAATKQGWISSYQALESDAKELLKKRMGNYCLSASDLAAFIDLKYAGPQQVYQRRILRAPGEPTTPAIAYGSLVHAVFEQITNGGLSDADALELFREKATDLPLPSHDLAELQERGEHDLKITLAAFRDILRAPGAKAEVNLHPEHPHLVISNSATGQPQDIPLTGLIDHLHIDPAEKILEIYDFKTGKYHPEKWTSQPTLYKYMLQLGFYKLLLNLSPTYRDYKVKTAHILFVSPDSEGKVYDKIYEYNDADESELKQLIPAVYHQLTTLKFLDHPDLNLPADEKNGLKEIKAFVAQLINHSES